MSRWFQGRNVIIEGQGREKLLNSLFSGNREQWKKPERPVDRVFTECCGLFK